MKPILFNSDMVRAILDGRKSVTRRVVKPQPNMFSLRDGIKPPYRPDDILYVRETWAKIDGDYVFKADDESPEGWHLTAWHPSIHMPREAARIFLRVTDVRVERLKEIDDEEAKAEGSNWRNGKHVGFEEKMRRSAVDRFAEIWDSTIKPADRGLYGWLANPWVWVIAFERCEKPEGD